MNGTESKIDTPVARGGSRFELIDKDGMAWPWQFHTAQAAADRAKTEWPDQEQDPDRTGKGWDIQVVR